MYTMTHHTRVSPSVRRFAEKQHAVHTARGRSGTSEQIHKFVSRTEVRRPKNTSFFVLAVSQLGP